MARVAAHKALSGTGMAAVNFSDVVTDTSNTQLLALIDSILNVPQRLNYVAKRSHRHQLGFYKFVMLEKGYGKCLRLHWWDEMSKQFKEDAHSHCASFVSRIVTGTLTENIFYVTDGLEQKQFSYRVEQATNQCVAQYKGYVKLHLTRTVVHDKGTIYTKNAEEVHNAVDVEPGTISISEWESRNKSAMVYKELNSSATDCLIEKGMSEQELHRHLSTIKQEILSA